jgi:RNA polymerase sigma factor (sigma-70 family)
MRATMKLKRHEPEESLVEEATLYGELFERHAREIYRFCFRRIADGRTAEDLTQAVFLEAWRRRRQVQLPPEAMRPWLFGVAHNLLRNHHRSLRRHKAALARLPRPRSDADLGADLAQRLDDEQRAQRALEHFRRLPQDDQDVIALCAWAEMSYDDAARALGVPVGTVRSRLSRARARLAEHASEPREEGAGR